MVFLVTVCDEAWMSIGLDVKSCKRNAFVFHGPLSSSLKIRPDAWSAQHVWNFRPGRGHENCS